MQRPAYLTCSGQIVDRQKDLILCRVGAEPHHLINRTPLFLLLQHHQYLINLMAINSDTQRHPSNSVCCPLPLDARQLVEGDCDGP